jgi:lipopolysaccharide transport system permease protein
MWQNLKELYYYREMIKNLVRKELRTRYKGSVLGFLWTFINPLLLLVVYTIVFSIVMRVNIDNFSMFLFVALLPWIFFSTSVIISTGSIIANKDLIKKIYFPREVLPISVVSAGILNLLFGFVILLPCLLIFGIRITSAIIYLPIVVILIYIITMGVSLITACLNVYFRDTEQIIGIAMTAWFFFTPILYPVEIVPDKFLKLFFLNPMAPIILAFREILFYGKPPNFQVLGISYTIAFLVILYGYNLFLKLQKNFAEEI